MRLISKERLKSFLGPSRKMSARKLARYVGVHPSFIDHLTAGRRRSCDTVTATRIAEALDVPLEILFEARKSTGEQIGINRGAA